MENGEKKSIKISVRNLVEFVLRSGDLDNRRMPGVDKDAMQAGSRIHRKIQRRMGASYQPEVFLRHTVDEDQFQIIIEGRADGIINEPDQTIIDEIKGVYFDIHHLDEPVAVHLAQVFCYGYMYCFLNRLTAVTLQMTYCNIDTEEIKRFQIERSYEELELWFQGLIHEYVKWARYLYLHGLRRDESIRQLDFPFAYRAGQKDLAVSVYRTIARKKTLFIQAPTGIGKTLSTVFPSLKAIGEGYGEKLFYLTAKTITRGVAEDTFQILRGAGLYFGTVTITAKEKLCILDKPECNPDACPYAKGHFDRVNDAVFDIIHQESGITRDIMLVYADKYRICPFEFCLDISNWMDGIICDYNYVFDPNVRLKRYFSEGLSGEYLFLVDEAHNLVNRAREMYSAVLVKEDVLLVKRILKERSGRLCGFLDRCNKILLEMKRECDGYQILPDINHLVAALMTMFGEMERFMEENPAFEDRDLVLDFYFQVRNFLYIFELVDDNYRIYTDMNAEGKFILKLLCVNPAKNLEQCLSQGNSTVFFSATLLPIRYYRELLSGNPDDYAVYAESPFAEENRLILVAKDVSSKFTRRNQNEYQKIVDYIQGVVRGKTGNYMVFFPSYQYLNAVEAILTENQQSLEFDFQAQSSRMNEEERESFLALFEEQRTSSFAALCVIGGVFSEGIDLREERLIGAIIVGTGLPMVCNEQEILQKYFDDQQKPGFDFAYQYPGMNKVMQAAGRVIRTMQDKGVIVLLDERFLRRDYLNMFPREWEDYKAVNRITVENSVRGFWNGF